MTPFSVIRLFLIFGLLFRNLNGEIEMRSVIIEGTPRASSPRSPSCDARSALTSNASSMSPISTVTILLPYLPPFRKCVKIRLSQNKWDFLCYIGAIGFFFACCICVRGYVYMSF